MKGKKKALKSPSKRNTLLDVSRNKLYINGILIFIFTVVLFFMTIQKVETEKINVKIGDRAPLEIRATKDIVDKQATEKLKREAANRVQPRYRISPSIQMNMKSILKEFFDSVRELKEDDSMTTSMKIELLIEDSRIPLSRNEYQTVLRMEEEELNNFEYILNDIINQIMGAGIKEEDLEYEKENVKKIFETMDLDENKRELGVSLINNTIQPNEFIDEELTQRRIDEELEKVEPVIIKEHQIIVRKGDIIDSNALELIKESGLLREKEGYDSRTVLGVLILIILFQVLILGHIYNFNLNIIGDNRFPVMLIIITAILLISQGMYNISPYIMPVSAVALLIAILLDVRLAIIVNIFMVFLLSFILRLDDTLMTMYLIAGSIGAFLATRPQQRYNIFIHGLLIGISNILVILSFGLIKNLGFMEILIRSGYGLTNGLFCGILAIGTLPIWENVFKILTPLKLMELSNPNQPLLKRLLVEAPGTYHHSIIVGNLSERAAEVIGADPLIARVGAYYHDIGKLTRPYFFKENQIGTDNPHDKLTPNMSTMIITSHVKDGITLGKKNKLPKEIIDIIAQHHGDTAVSYFYHKAKQNGQADVKIEDFRYDGPKPQSKEAAIVMLADSTEAAVRSIKEPTSKNIEEMITNIINGKLEDGQLDECGLSLKNLKDIKKAFSAVMMGIFHERIEYPNSNLAKEEGKA